MRHLPKNNAAAGRARAAATAAAAQVRASRRPYLLETWTYRTRGHFEPDDQAYVDKEELAAWLARDPISLCRDRLIADGTLSALAATELAERVDHRIADAVAFATAAPFPSVEEITLEANLKG